MKNALIGGLFVLMILTALGSYTPDSGSSYKHWVTGGVDSVSVKASSGILRSVVFNEPINGNVLITLYDNATGSSGATKIAVITPGTQNAFGSWKYNLKFVNGLFVTSQILLDITFVYD